MRYLYIFLLIFLIFPNIALSQKTQPTPPEQAGYCTSTNTYDQCANIDGFCKQVLVWAVGDKTGLPCTCPLIEKKTGFKGAGQIVKYEFFPTYRLQKIKCNKNYAIGYTSYCTSMIVERIGEPWPGYDPYWHNVTLLGNGKVCPDLVDTAPEEWVDRYACEQDASGAKTYKYGGDFSCGEPIFIKLLACTADPSNGNILNCNSLWGYQTCCEQFEKIIPCDQLPDGLVQCHSCTGCGAQDSAARAECDICKTEPANPICQCNDACYDKTTGDKVPCADPPPACDPFIDPACGANCDPAKDPTCNCDPATDPTCGPNCDPFINPACGANCDPATDPNCSCDPATDPTCGPGNGDNGGGCDPATNPQCTGEKPCTTEGCSGTIPCVPGPDDPACIPIIPDPPPCNPQEDPTCNGTKPCDTSTDPTCSPIPCQPGTGDPACTLPCNLWWDGWYEPPINTTMDLLNDRITLINLRSDIVSIPSCGGSPPTLTLPGGNTYSFTDGNMDMALTTMGILCLIAACIACYHIIYKG